MGQCAVLKRALLLRYSVGNLGQCSFEKSPIIEIQCSKFWVSAVFEKSPIIEIQYRKFWVSVQF